MRILLLVLAILTVAAPVARAAPQGPYYVVLLTFGWNDALRNSIPVQMIVWRRPAFPSQDDCAKWVTHNIPDKVHARLYDEHPRRVFGCKTEATGDYPFSVVGTVNHWAELGAYVRVTWLDQTFSLAEWQR